MDLIKRNLLIVQLSRKPEPQYIPIEVFLDGNDDESSIGCNLLEHPGMKCFQQAFARLRKRPDVEAIYAEISELEPGEECWPFVERVLVFGSIPTKTLARAVSKLQPSEVEPGQPDDGIAKSLMSRHRVPVQTLWWD